jgi:hypothetical protein
VLLLNLGIERNPIPVHFLAEVFVAIAVHFYDRAFSLALNKLVFGDVQIERGLLLRDSVVDCILLRVGRVVGRDLRDQH